MNKFIEFLEKIEPDKKTSPFLHTLYDGFHTFLFAPKTITKSGVHLRDGMDLKRTMVHVVIALQLCYAFGSINIGHQHYKALGMYSGFFDAFHLKLIFGLVHLLPIFVVTHLVGLGIEFYYAARKGHPIEEGFLVSGALIPLIMPPDLPLWILAVATAFAVIIGKEAFGGTGMNIFNIAILTRMFVFIAYPLEIIGDKVWIAGLDNINGITTSSYGFVIENMINPLLHLLGSKGFIGGLPVVDTYTGATPLDLAAKGGWANVVAHYSPSEMFWGSIPGSVGETSKFAIIIGAIMLIVTGIGSWRIMLSMLVGGVLSTMLFNAFPVTDYMAVPWYYQMIMGSFLFAMVFMATDPVTASSTNIGKIIYGFLIGVIGMIIRVLNPAYPEGWMLAILFMNVFASLIDYFVLQANINKRLKNATR
jgi:Na+-transporting NADH:ubiquinone oxidoreductase subunit B